MYLGSEVFVAITFFFVPIIVLMGTLGYEIPITTFSTNIEVSTRIIPLPESFSDSYSEFRIYFSDTIIHSDSVLFKLNVGQFTIPSETAQFSFIPRVGVTLEFSNLIIRFACFKNAYLGGVYLRF